MQDADELIVAEIRKNNELALRELYKTHYQMVVHLIISNSGTEQEAKDVYQDALIAFYEKVKQQNFALTCKIKTYLYAVCRRLWLKRLAEKRRFTVHIDEGDAFAGVEEELMEIAEKEREYHLMEKSMGELGEPCHSIIEDFYIKELSMDEITEKFGYTNSDNAKNQKYKCLQRLKKMFFTSYRVQPQ